MYDRELVVSILEQIEEAATTIEKRFSNVGTVNDFTDSEEGMTKLDSICMQFIAIGESIKQVDQITEKKLFSQYPDIDWKGIMGFRDIISHHYFDIDAEQVFWVCSHQLDSSTKVLGEMIQSLNTKGEVRF